MFLECLRIEFPAVGLERRLPRGKLRACRRLRRGSHAIFLAGLTEGLVNFLEVELARKAEGLVGLAAEKSLLRVGLRCIFLRSGRLCSDALSGARHRVGHLPVAAARDLAGEFTAGLLEKGVKVNFFRRLIILHGAVDRLVHLALLRLCGRLC